MPERANLKAESSLVGLAYLEQIYRNDASNEQFLALQRQITQNIPQNAQNPYRELFQERLAPKTIANLSSIQLSLDYASDRTRQPESAVQQAIQQLQSALQISR